MGIPGLTSYVNAIRKLWTKTELRNTKVVIDGNCLIYSLYYDSGIDFRCGGEYDEFARLMEGFFHALLSNGVVPFVVMDGAMDPSGKKLDTLVGRVTGTIESAAALCAGTASNNDRVLPRLTKIVMIQIMQARKVKFVVSDCEADQEIASLASHFDCPVISNDSDFFIFDIKGGYIPISSLDWHSSAPTADLFMRDKLAAHLQIAADLLPLFASLLGNDFISSHTLEPFERALKQIEPSRNMSRKAARFLSVAHFLCKFKRLEEGFDAMLMLIKKENERDVLRQALEVSLEGYTILDSNLTDFFEQDIVRSSLTTVVKEALPPWVVDVYRRGRFPWCLLDTLITSTRFLHSQVENTREISSNCCTLALRMSLYAILGANNEENQKRDSKKNGVKEFDRHGKGLRSYYLQPPLQPVVEGYGKLPSMDAVPSLTKKDRGELALILLGSKTRAIASLPIYFQLYGACTRYLVNHADPPIHGTDLDAIILTSLELHYPDMSGPSGGGRYFIPAKRHKQFRKLYHGNGTPFHVPAQHSFAQWQAVMLEGIFLNYLLMEPLVAPDISKVYSGVTAHRMVEKLEEGAPPKSLTRHPERYEKLRHAVLEGISHKLKQVTQEPDPSSDQSAVEKAGKRRERKAKNPTAALASNRFALLLGSDSESSSEDDDE